MTATVTHGVGVRVGVIGIGAPSPWTVIVAASSARRAGRLQDARTATTRALRAALPQLGGPSRGDLLVEAVAHSHRMNAVLSSKNSA